VSLVKSFHITEIIHIHNIIYFKEKPYEKAQDDCFLVNDIDVSYSNLVYLMTKKAAEKYDCNLIVYEGRSFNNPSMADSQHQISYSFVDNTVWTE